MKRWIPAFAALGVALTGCPGPKPTTDNPIDAEMQTMFDEAGMSPVEASTHELCRRLYADLIDRFPTADEVASTCEGRSVGDIVDDLQSRPEYLITSRSHWRDRLDTNDVQIDWRYVKELYALVDQLQRGELEYDQFVIQAASHPAFVLQVQLSAPDRAQRAFRAFLGREATDAEANDFGSLYRPWFPYGDQYDPDFAYTYRIAAGVIPAICLLGQCDARLMGGGSINLSTQEFDVLRYEDLSADDRAALQEPGRVLARQDLIWEAAADAILSRFLQWSDGGRFPRSPGVVTPKVRQIVADYLKETKNYPATEKLVLTSILYRGAAEVEPDGYGDDPLAPQPPVWAHGPVKWTRTETLLNSVGSVSIDLGACDARYTDSFAYFLLLQGYQDAGGSVPLSTLQADLVRLHDLQESIVPLTTYTDQGVSYTIPDQTFAAVARIIGGCPGFTDGRYDARAGLSYSFSQEGLAELVCIPTQVADNLFPPGGDTSVGGILTHQMRNLWSRNPTDEEIKDVEAAFANCTGPECTNAGLANGVCVALTTANEILFY